MTCVSDGFGGPPAYESRTPRDQNAHGAILPRRIGPLVGGARATSDLQVTRGVAGGLARHAVHRVEGVRDARGANGFADRVALST